MQLKKFCTQIAWALAVIAVLMPLAARADKLADILKRGYLIVGTTSSTPPFGFKDEKGELTGFDVDMSRLIALALFGDAGKVKFELLSNEARWPALQNDQVDMVAQFATITPSRLVRVGFTPRYFDTGMTVAVAKDSPIKKLAELDSPDITIATLTVPEQLDPSKRGRCGRAECRRSWSIFRSACGTGPPIPISRSFRRSMAASRTMESPTSSV